MRRFYGRLLAANIVRAWRFRLLQFRLVTFGLYEPHPFYGFRVFAHPSWQVNPRVAWLLVRHLAAYSRWLAEMEAVTQRGAAGWWEHHLPRADYTRLRAWIAAENAPPAALPGEDVERRTT
jgi:hypothetical protein